MSDKPRTAGEEEALVEVVTNLATNKQFFWLEKDSDFWEYVAENLEDYHGISRSSAAAKRKYELLEEGVGINVEEILCARKERGDLWYQQAKDMKAARELREAKELQEAEERRDSAQPEKD